MSKLTLSLLSLLTLALASPIATPTEPVEVSIRRTLPLGTAIGGALDLPPEATAGPSPEDVEAAVAKLMTVTVINKYGKDVSTIHVDARGAPKPVSGNTKPGKMKNGDKSVFVVKEGWSGNVAVNDAKL